MTKENQNKLPERKERFFECDCGCGQKIKVCWMSWKNGRIVDIGFTKNRSWRPKIGIVLRDKQIDKFIDYLKLKSAE